METELITPKETMKILNITRITLKKLVDNGNLIPYKIKGLKWHKYRKKDVLILIEKPKD